jgi:energy-coupling factor transporter transmembrane protein EcfT
MPAGLKLLLLLALSAGAFVPYALLPAALVIAAGACAARMTPAALFRGGKGLFCMASLVILCRAFSIPAAEGAKALLPFLGFHRAGFFEGLLFACRMALSFAAGALFYSTTTMGALRRALGSLERRLRPSGRAPFSLGFCLMLGFIPRFFALWDESALAWEARAGGKGQRRLFFLVPQVTARMLYAAAATAQALEARGCE